jgi:transposase
MSHAFIKGVETHLPQAAIVFDRFHITKVINKAIDDIRRLETKDNPLMKGSRYLFLSNQENHSRKQRVKFDDIKISVLNTKTMRAYHIREAFQQIYIERSPKIFEKLLKKWYYWASHCRIDTMVKAAKSNKNHLDGILNWAYQKLATESSRASTLFSMQQNQKPWDTEYLIPLGQSAIWSPVKLTFQRSTGIVIPTRINKEPVFYGKD